MKFSKEYASYHASVLYPRGTYKRNMSDTTFKKEVELAHLVGRAFACQKIIQQHIENPYQTIDEMIGDLQLEMISCMNGFKAGSNAKMPKLTFENLTQYEVKEPNVPRSHVSPAINIDKHQPGSNDQDVQLHECQSGFHEVKCLCGHAKKDHIYEEGACRPGFACPCNCFVQGEFHEAP
jgi:hypothetical protein